MTEIRGTPVTFASMGLADEDMIGQVCELLVHSFRELSPTWVPTVEAARREVFECLDPQMISRVLLVDGSVVGWVGARHDYGAVWELHPLAVAEAHRGRGYGRALVEDVERLVVERGALTLQLGTSDEAGRTTLAGVDLYRDPLGNLQNLTTTASHPLRFWQAMGYAVVGVMPDAEGPGKPTILLARRVGRTA